MVNVKENRAARKWSRRIQGAAVPSRTIFLGGRVHRKKALDQLILAWQNLETHFPDWSVQIIRPDEKGETARLSALVE